LKKFPRYRKAEPLECGSDDRSSSLSPSSEKIVDRLLRQRFDQKSARLTLFMPEVPEDNKEALGKLLFRAVSPIDHPQVGHAAAVEEGGHVQRTISQPWGAPCCAAFRGSFDGETRSTLSIVMPNKLATSSTRSI
jgi:hypothetical protein